MKENISRYLSRGRFLKLCTRAILGLAGFLGLGGLIRFFSFQPDPGSPSVHDLGPADGFPVSGKLIRPDIPAVIYQVDEGFQAYSLICTHLGCTLEDNEEGFSCPCHGSEFSPAGEVIRGPAVEDLKALEVEVTEEGKLLIHAGGGSL